MLLYLSQKILSSGERDAQKAADYLLSKYKVNINFNKIIYMYVLNYAGRIKADCIVTIDWMEL